MSDFLVRKLDPSSAFPPSNPGSLPEIHAVESVLSKAFSGGKCRIMAHPNTDAIPDIFTAVVTAHDPNGLDTGHVGPFWVSTVVAGLLGGEVYVAETNDAERKIIGCAVWFGPGHSMYDTEEQQKHALGPLMASFDDKLQHWWHAVFLPKYDNFVTSVLGVDMKHNSWHLQTLGVDPGYQRKGAATLLVNTIVEKASLSGAKLCVELENDVNVKHYSPNSPYMN
ncbi:hypothetical protein B0H17DRAFT_1003148 [Mycena rosella]|uniref:N-acetyltransferase domain-containing protein n=1 Tax=Mycena rosella TaxID=1033263 RepID=A0AAD7GRV7_MYCRO|nr:hypothetical protein B0H17DRAFT_1003148 [Mycena rosella]